MQSGLEQHETDRAGADEQVEARARPRGEGWHRRARNAGRGRRRLQAEPGDAVEQPGGDAEQRAAQLPDPRFDASRLGPPSRTPRWRRHRSGSPRAAGRAGSRARRPGRRRGSTDRPSSTNAATMVVRPSQSTVGRRSCSTKCDSTSKRTIPEAKIGWTTEIGAKDRASPWQTRPSSEQAQPSSHGGEPNRVRSISQTCRAWSSGSRCRAIFSTTVPLPVNSADSAAIAIPAGVWVCGLTLGRRAEARRIDDRLGVRQNRRSSGPERARDVVIGSSGDGDLDEPGGSEELLEGAAGEDAQMTDHLTTGAAVDAAQADLGEQRLNSDREQHPVVPGRQVGRRQQQRPAGHEHSPRLDEGGVGVHQVLDQLAHERRRRRCQKPEAGRSRRSRPEPP